MSRIQLGVCFTLVSMLVIAGATSSRKLIVEVDVGVDDFQALVALLNGESRGELKIVAIVCSDGNTALVNCKRNLLRLLQMVERTDIPVYAGSFRPIMPRKSIENFYGLDGFGDLNLTETIKWHLIKKEIAPTAIARLLKNHKKEISYMALAPPTNLALAIRMYENVLENLKDVYIIGGNYPRKEVDYNFLADPVAANIVLTSVTRPIILLPFQVCIVPGMTFGWRFNAKVESNPIWDLLEKAERKIFAKAKDTDPYISCDPILAQIYLQQDAIVKNSSTHNATVELCGDMKGLMVIESSDIKDNILIIEEVVPDMLMNSSIQEYRDICNNYFCKKCLI